jgi:hypothetical protein
MGGRGHLVVAAALVGSLLTGMTEARALDCPVLDVEALDSRAAPLSPTARERLFEEIALETMAVADLIAVASPVSATLLPDQQASQKTFVVRFRIDRPLLGTTTPTVDILYDLWCDGDCEDRSESDLLWAAERLSLTPNEYTLPRVPELAAIPDGSRLIAAGRFLSPPLPNIAFGVGDCYAPGRFATGHPDVDRWIAWRLRWLLGASDPAFAHWGPPPSR